jgi:hypothetical protein
LPQDVFARQKYFLALKGFLCAVLRLIWRGRALGFLGERCGREGTSRVRAKRVLNVFVRHAALGRERSDGGAAFHEERRARDLDVARRRPSSSASASSVSAAASRATFCLLGIVLNDERPGVVDDARADERGRPARGGARDERRRSRPRAAPLPSHPRQPSPWNLSNE